jgi:hypothetical protein
MSDLISELIKAQRSRALWMVIATIGWVIAGWFFLASLAEISR